MEWVSFGLAATAIAVSVFAVWYARVEALAARGLPWAIRTSGTDLILVNQWHRPMRKVHLDVPEPMGGRFGNDIGTVGAYMEKKLVNGFEPFTWGKWIEVTWSPRIGRKRHWRAFLPEGPPGR